MKRLSIYLLVIAMFTVNSFAFDEFDILDKEVKDISLEEASEFMLKESSAARTAEINRDKASYSDEEKRNSIDRLSELSGLPIMALNNYDGLDKILLQMTYEFGKEQKDYNYEAEINNIKYKLRKKYFSVLNVKDVYGIRKESLDLAKASLAELEKKFELGLVNEIQVSDARIALSEAEIALREAGKDLILIKMDLNSFLGYDLKTNINPTDKLEAVEISKKTLGASKKDMLENNNNLRLLEYVKKLKTRSLEGLRLRYTTGGSFYQNERLILEEASKKLEDTKQGLEIDLLNKYMTMMINYHKVNVAKEALKLAEKKRDVAKLSYDLGLS
ncbi:MAG: hypothetical protein CSB15_01940, partial [Clostridiales bacterium]